MAAIFLEPERHDFLPRKSAQQSIHGGRNVLVREGVADHQDVRAAGSAVLAVAIIAEIQRMMRGHLLQAGASVEAAVKLVLYEMAVVEHAIGIIEDGPPQGLEVQMMQIETVHGNGVEHHVDIEDADPA